MKAVLISVNATSLFNVFARAGIWEKVIAGDDGSSGCLCHVWLRKRLGLDDKGIKM